MVECYSHLDLVFHCLSDATRRDILRRVAKRELSVGTLATRYDMSLSGVAKHIAILEKAELITKRRAGKEQRISMRPQALRKAEKHLGKYQTQFEKRFATLDRLIIRTS
jgi:DNA-binding transcriptional ArsR family regulator